MNRTAKRHQKQLARKAAKANRRGQPPQSPVPGLGATLDAAVSQHQAGQLDQAKRLYSAILSQEPRHAVALHFLGVIAYQQGDAQQAIASIGKAIALRPDYAEAHGNRGLALQALGQFDEAVESYHKAVTFNPHIAEVHSNLGNAFHSLGRLDDAVASFHNALKIKPEYAEAHYNLGNTLKGLGLLDEAVASYRRSLDINPRDARAHNNLGFALQELGRLDVAEASYHRSLEINPNYAEAHYNLGNILKDQGKLDAAVASYNKALTISPDYANAHHNLGFAFLNGDRLKEGLDELEWRWRTPKLISKARCFSPPLWDGLADLKGRTILVWGEQGPQDMTLWSSCMPYISGRAGHCILECPAKLVTLFARSFPDVEVRPENRSSDAERDDFDFHLPMGSLFRHFLPELTDAAGAKAFLVPDPGRTEFWRNRLEEIGSGPFVGISWKSPHMTPDRAPNYTELADWAPAFANREAVFVNLQCSDYEDDLAMARRDFGTTVHNFDDLDLYDDLDDVAALAGALDIAISVSTAVAAITAGVGTPTWVLSWRQSSWNNFLFVPRGPSVRFFQRNTGESWDAAFTSIAECLADRENRG